jgi:crotonobetainyl-CoA:carnitine CoA-transferase CaiB-like acyl-CoA transferase
MMLGAVEPKFWTAFCRAADRLEWIERHSSPIPQNELIADVAAFFRSITLADCVRRFSNVDCCLTPVLDLREAIESPHHRSRGVVRRSQAGSLQALFPAYVDAQPPLERPEPVFHRQASRAGGNGGLSEKITTGEKCN